jgi:hypothetical protein
MPPVVVHEVGKGLSWRQFVDLRLVFSGESPEAGWLLAVQRKRLTSNRYPGDFACFLARRRGEPVGRITAHRLEGQADGSFGFFAVERPGDSEVAGALIAAAATWLAERGAARMIGPLSWTAEEEAGVLVGGADVRPTTGRAWTPAWYGDLLAGAGLHVMEELRSYRLAAVAGAGPTAGTGPGLLSPAELMVPADLTAYADPALLLRTATGDGAVVAVPDVAAELGRGTARQAWKLAKRARTRAWDTCVVLALDGDPSLVVPALCAAAGRAGYSWVVSPWAPPTTEAALVHRLYWQQLMRQGIETGPLVRHGDYAKLGRVAPAPSQAQGEA